MSDSISRADAIEAVLTYFIPRSHTGERGEHEEDFVRTVFNALPSTDAEPKWNCTANFVAEQLERLRNMTDEERWDFFIKFFSPSAEAVQGEWKHTITWQPYCSNCGYVVGEDEEYSPFWKYCPMCGAIMKGGAE